MNTHTHTHKASTMDPFFECTSCYIFFLCFGWEWETKGKAISQHVSVCLQGKTKVLEWIRANTPTSKWASERASKWSLGKAIGRVASLVLSHTDISVITSCWVQRSHFSLSVSLSLSLSLCLSLRGQGSYKRWNTRSSQCPFVPANSQTEHTVLNGTKALGWTLPQSDASPRTLPCDFLWTYPVRRFPISTCSLKKKKCPWTVLSSMKACEKLVEFGWSGIMQSSI